MPALSSTRDPLRGLANKTTQGIATASAVVHKALARLVTNGGRQHGPEGRTR